MLLTEAFEKMALENKDIGDRLLEMSLGIIEIKSTTLKWELGSKKENALNINFCLRFIWLTHLNNRIYEIYT